MELPVGCIDDGRVAPSLHGRRTLRSLSSEERDCTRTSLPLKIPVRYKGLQESRGDPAWRNDWESRHYTCEARVRTLPKGVEVQPAGDERNRAAKYRKQKETLRFEVSDWQERKLQTEIKLSWLRKRMNITALGGEVGGDSGEGLERIGREKSGGLED